MVLQIDAGEQPIDDQPMQDLARSTECVVYLSLSEASEQ